MRWQRITRFDAQAALLADRHYTRQTPGSNQFMPSGQALVLATADRDAVWGSSWQISSDGTLWAVHDWPRAWVCSIFRNESGARSSELIGEAVAATIAAWGDAPSQGFVTFVDAAKVRSRNPGYCFIAAGWKPVGYTRSGKRVLQLPRDEFPQPEAALGAALRLPILDERTTGAQRRVIGGEIR